MTALGKDSSGRGGRRAKYMERDYDGEQQRYVTISDGLEKKVILEERKMYVGEKVKKKKRVSKHKNKGAVERSR